ncbi:hypothetical protein [Enterococcus casseliflavus]
MNFEEKELSQLISDSVSGRDDQLKKRGKSYEDACRKISRW